MLRIQQSAANPDTQSTNVQQTTFEGWTLITTPDSQSGGVNGFEIWRTGDAMQNAALANINPQAMAGNGSQFLELNNATSAVAQTLGISRAVTTEAGASYTLSFDYAGRPGFSADYTRIGVYVDGVKLATVANTSPNTGLSWQALSYTFVGTGGTQTIRLVSEATLFNAGGRGAMIDDISITETRAYNSTAGGGTANLSNITASLTDTDGSEALSLRIDALPVGSILSDGTRSFTATATSTTANITGWTLNALTFKPAANAPLGTITLTVVATSTEGAGAVTGSATASTSASLAITVHAANVASPIVLDLNGDGVRTIAMNRTSNQSTGFDLLGTGELVNSGWLSGQDGFLAWDRNGDGQINGLSELFGGQVGEGFSKLAELDANQDGLITVLDPMYAHLVIWQDANENRLTDEGELKSLSDRNIVSLDLRYSVLPTWQEGNLLLESSQATLANGRSIAMVDAYFAFEAMQAATGANAPSKEALTPSTITGVSRPESTTATSNASSIDTWVPLSKETLWPLRTDGALQTISANRQPNGLMSSLITSEQQASTTRRAAMDDYGWEGSTEQGDTMLEEPSKTSTWAQWMKKWRKK